MMRLIIVLGSLLALLPISQTAGSNDDVTSLVDVILSRDQEHLQQVLYNTEPYNTFQDVYFMVKGLQAIGITDAHKQFVSNACTYVTNKPAKDLRDIFYASSVATILGNFCKFPGDSVKEILATTSSKGNLNTRKLYYLLTSMANLDMKIDEGMPAALVDALEKEDTPQSYGHAFLAASVIPDADLTVLFDHIEEIVAQADETETTLYFEGGLKVTSDVINGIFALASRVGSKPVITEAQATKFGNFLVASKYAASLSDVMDLLTAARTLSNNEFVVPTAITLTDTRSISGSNPDLTVRLTTLMGGAVPGFNVKVKSLETPDGGVVPRTRAMNPGKDMMTYSYPMIKDTTGPGPYKVIVSTESNEESPYVQLSGVELSVIVSLEVAVSQVELAIVDKDQGVATKSVRLEFPDTSKATLQADQHSKVVMTFNLLNKETSTPITVHQAFVRLTLEMQEIFFVVTPTSEKLYSFELDVAGAASDFGDLSGTYSMSLIVGDSSLDNPFSWDMGSLQLKFPGTPVQKAEKLMYKSKPIIEHKFRVPEKRPSVVVSSAFTVLVLVPLGVLLIVWLAMGTNFSNIMNGGIWSLFFHIGLGAILALYYCFWIQMNMFTTLKYLAIIGLFTFLTGNKMLRSIAKARQA